MLASFDVESLFTNVPVGDSIAIMKEQEMLPGKLMDLAEICLTSCYFQYREVIYKQREGVAMGSPLSPVVAEIFMEDYERRAIESFPLKPKLWLRYVDDVLVIWQHGRTELKKFLDFLNNFHPAIRFTIEEEEDGRIPFLDLLIVKEPDCSLSHTVYRKPTATGRYLHAESHHHPAQKKGIIKTLVHRASKLCSNEAHLQDELARLKKDMQANGYEAKEVDAAFRDVVRKQSAGSEPNTEELGSMKKRVALPFIRGISERISRLLRRHDLEVAFKPVDKVGDWLGSTKDRQRLQDKGVYLLPCDCGAVYVGQTGKKIATRIGQHNADYRLGRVKTSAVAKHGEECSRQVLFDQAKTLAKEDHLGRRLIREAIEIYKRPDAINRSDGLILQNTWRPAITAHGEPTEGGEASGAAERETQELQDGQRRESSAPIGPRRNPRRGKAHKRDDP